MNGSTQETKQNGLGIILPAALRISFRVVGFILWTTLAGAAFGQTKEQREVRDYAATRVAVEHLQRWVNAGHDEWCRDAKSVAEGALQRIAEPAEAEYELMSASMQKENETETRAVYNYHSLDGRVTYRITVRRYPWLEKTAGGIRNAVWAPERAEILTKSTLD